MGISPLMIEHNCWQNLSMLESELYEWVIWIFGPKPHNYSLCLFWYQIDTNSFDLFLKNAQKNMNWLT